MDEANVLRFAAKNERRFALRIIKHGANTACGEFFLVIVI